MVPAAGADGAGIAQAALNLIRQSGRRDEVAAGRMEWLSYCENCGDVIRGVGGFFGKVSVVVVQIPEMHAVGEGGPLRRGHVLGPDYRCRFGTHDGLCQCPRNSAWCARDRSHCAAERIYKPALYLMNGLGWEVFEAQVVGVVCQAMGKVWHRFVPCVPVGT